MVSVEDTGFVIAAVSVGKRMRILIRTPPMTKLTVCIAEGNIADISLIMAIKARTVNLLLEVHPPD